MYSIIYKNNWRKID